MTIGEVYVDESGTHDQSPMLTVAGYFFEVAQSRRFSRDWAKTLLHHRLPYAHQTDCANGQGDYRSMEIADRIGVQTKLIENIRRRARFGFGVSVDPAMYAKIVGTTGNAPSAYTFALQGCLTIVRRWILRTNFEGLISYVFESGHRSQGEADRYIRDALLNSEVSQAKHCYAGHRFMDKRTALPLQASDLLAWQYQHFHARRIRQGVETPRKDFTALIRPVDVCIDHTEESLVRFREEIVDQGWLVDRY